MSGAEASVLRRCEPVEDARFDPAGGPPLPEALVEALAAVTEAEPTELPPLYDVVDLDALCHLFDRADDNGVYSFNYRRFQVFIGAGGRIRICDRQQPTDPAPVFADGSTQ